MDNHGGQTTCEKLKGLASLVGAYVASAFFASLEWCSCINLATTDDGDGAEKESHDRPLISTLGRLSTAVNLPVRELILSPITNDDNVVSRVSEFEFVIKKQ